MAEEASSSSSIFSLKATRPPDDTVFYSIYPDSSAATSAAELGSLHSRITDLIHPLTAPYIWQHQPFTLSLSSSPSIPHLSGHLRFGDNLEDEWFVVYLLFHISRTFPNLSIRVWDSDGEFLLIESAFHLPKWLNPDTSLNRVFIRRGLLHIIPKSILPGTPDLEESLRVLVSRDDDPSLMAPDAVQFHLSKRIGQYPEHAYRNVHRVRIAVPVSVAWVLRKEPSLVSFAVEGFYDRDIDGMKFAVKMEKFLPNGKEEEMVEVVVKMPRAMYAQLVQQRFQAPRCYPMPDRSNVGKYVEAELGMKIACGFEMMYQLRKKQTDEGKGSTWEVYRESLERSGLFEGLLQGSKEYKRLLENAEENYKNSFLPGRASEVLNAPVRCIDDILALPHSVDDFKGLELPQSDDDSWLYGGEDELNAALQERQKEVEFYDLKRKKKHTLKEQKDGNLDKSFDDYDLGDITKSMDAFVKKISSYEGAEVPEDRKLKDLDFDADQFMKHIESVMGVPGSKDDGSDVDLEEESISDMDFDDYEDHSEDIEDGGEGFMDSYSDALNQELKTTTLNKTFEHAKEQSSRKKDEGTSGVSDEMEFTPVDVDFNLVKNLLESVSSQEGLPGPASNLLGLMGVKLPDEAGKDK
ncbi:protein ecdysoneless homolog [Primulina tabacum]|uniref:protein ecdysoneless homolog n=1 Tax=Primulina tabacum TaxID=48773 RepID=UPI003F593FF4